MSATRILVPLDGSPLAESALAEALTLARALPAEVILLQVIPSAELIHEWGITIPVDEQWEVRRARALEYLNRVRARPEWQGTTGEAAVVLGSPAEAILEYSRKHAIDRIVMATHGRTGVARWVIGSVADKVLRASDKTVILVRAGLQGESV
jgi:nucleotide-binding universal stress UspA family protein